MKNNKKPFYQDMMSGVNGRISSKRVLGSFILLVLLSVIVINTFWGNEHIWLGEAFITMIVGAFALLGIGVFEKKIKSPNEEEPNEEFDEEENI